MACNIHKDLDNEELHVPLDFSLAANDSFLSKNNLGILEWQLISSLGGGADGNGLITGSGAFLDTNTVGTIPSTGSFELAGDFAGTLFKVDGDTGKVTIDGLLDPSGLQFTQQASNPGDVNTIWINSADGKAYRGAVNLEVSVDGNGLFDGSGTIPTTTIATITDTVNFNGGLFGVGKTPLKTLDVNGDINIDNDYYKEGFKFIHTTHDTTSIVSNGNTFMGYRAAEANTLGVSNTLIGSSAGLNNISGNSNIAIGQTALLFNLNGDKNTAIGVNSLYNTTGNQNTGIGMDAGRRFTSGIENTAIGANSFGAGSIPAITGSYNVGLGYRSGLNFSGTSSQNISIGTFAGCDGQAAYDSSIGIGYNQQVTASNQMAIGSIQKNSSIQDIIIGTLAPTPNQWTPTNLKFRAGLASNNGDGTDTSGNDLTVSAGQSRGTGVNGTTDGSLYLQTTTTGTTGTTPNALATRLTIKGGTGHAEFTGDIEATTDGNGIILSSPDGLLRKKITIENITGNIITTDI